MKKTYMVYGLSGSSYDTNALGLYPLQDFPTYVEAENWLQQQYEVGRTKWEKYPIQGSHNQCLILEQFELSPLSA